MISGIAEIPYSEVREAFKENFSSLDELGASVCLFHNHRKVVDLWGGYQDSNKNRIWDIDTVVPVFSTTKAIAAACLAICHSRWLFNYNDKVAQHWPEFSQNNKGNISISQLLQHRAGLSALDKNLYPRHIKNRPELEKLLASQKPKWPPGSRQGYHVWTIGWYISALLSKLDPEERHLKEFIAQELKSLEGTLILGLEDNFPSERIAQIQPFSKWKGLFSMPPQFVMQFFNPWSVTFRSMLNPSFVQDHTNFNKREILKLEIGSGNGLANARGLASLIDQITDPQSKYYVGQNSMEYLFEYPKEPDNGFTDFIFKEDAFRFHAGFMKPSEKHNFSEDRRAFGGFGAGGSFVLHDPNLRMTLAYTMNKLSHQTMNMEREVKIRNAAQKCCTRVNSILYEN